MIDFINLSLTGLFIIINVLITEALKLGLPKIKHKNIFRYIPLIISVPLSILQIFLTGGFAACMNAALIIDILKQMFIITAGSNSSYDLIIKSLFKDKEAENIEK